VFSVSPAGNVPTTENVYGEVPPVTAIAALLNATPTSPVVAVAEQVTCGPPMIVIGQVALPTTPFASFTWIENDPDAVGVPLTAPVEVFSVSPAGNVPTIENVYGEVPPVTAIAGLLNATPTSPVVAVAEQVTCGPPMIVIGQVALPATPLASVTWIENEPAAVGVPVTAPVDVFSVSPAGNVPTIENVYGEVPPVTAIAGLLNATPTSPVVAVAEQVTCGPPMIVIGQVALPATPFESFTWIENDPDAVGVPLTAPVEVFSVRPAGSVPTIENVYGEVPPVTAIAGLLNATPTSPVVAVAEQVTCGPPMIVIGQVALPTTPFASVTWMEKVPAAVGVPVTAPVDVFKVSPAGNVPTTANVYGEVPPVTAIGPMLNAAPTSPVVPVAEQVTCGPPMIVIGQVALPTTPFASFTWIENEPDAVGVPVTAPVDVFSVSPAGNVPTIENVYGEVPPVTATAGLLNAAPTSPVIPVAEQVTCGPPMIVIGQVALPTTPFASFTWIENDPDAVGVPETAPVAVFSVSPAGNVPTIENVYGEVPPVTEIAGLLNAAPTSPVVPVAEHVTCGPAMIVNGHVPAATAPRASATWIENDPDAVGVPLTAPVDVFSVSPAGKVPTIENVYGEVPPVTVIAELPNAAPTSPVLPVAEQVREGGGMTVTEQLIVPVLPALSLIVTV
jgi:fumarate reductase subunit C